MGKIKEIKSILYDFFYQRITPPTEYARKIGVNIGEDNFLPDKQCWSSEPYLITVGSHCQITTGVRFLTHGGGQVVRDKYPEFDTYGKIIIGDWVYIGTNSLIMPGVTIEDHVIVAAGSVVTRSVPSGVVVGGNPAHIICTIEEYLERNKQYNTNKRNHKENKKIMLLLMDDKKFIKKPFMKQVKSKDNVNTQ